MGLGMMGMGGDGFGSDEDGRGWILVSVPVQTSSRLAFNSNGLTTSTCKWNTNN